VERRRLVIDDAARAYIEAVTAVNRPLFDRVHRLILHLHPDAAVSLSYGIPTYTVDNRRLHVGSWQHGVSIYGWSAGRDGGFTAHHPELRTSTGTIQLRPDTAAAVTDDELHDLIRAALAP